MKSDKKFPHDLPSPHLLSGTQIATGEGLFIAIVVGKHSCVGKIMGNLEQAVETTPLRKKLEKIPTDIGKLGMYAALLAIHVLILRFMITRFSARSMHLFDIKQPKDDGGIKEYIIEWIGYFLVGVAIVVVAVPEDLHMMFIVHCCSDTKTWSTQDCYHLLLYSVLPPFLVPRAS